MSLITRYSIGSRIFGDWMIVRRLGGNNESSIVFHIQRDKLGIQEQRVLKVIQIIMSEGQPNRLSPEQYGNYHNQLNSNTRSAAQEVQNMVALRGERNIVDYYDFQTYDWQEQASFGRDLLIQMELLQDVTPRGARVYSRGEVLRIGKDMCLALKVCHERGIVHSDIKPENIFRGHTGYKLGDFGISAFTRENGYVPVHAGTPGYVSPEQAGQIWDGHYDKRADLYSLGLTLYVLLNRGCLPFLNNPRPDRQAYDWAVRERMLQRPLPPPVDADPAFTEVIFRACAYDPAQRFQTAEEFYKALCWLEAGPQTGPQEPPPSRSRRKRKVWPVLLAAVVVIAAAVSGGILIHNSLTRQRYDSAIETAWDEEPSDYLEALDLLEKAMDQRPDQPQAYRDYVYILYRHGYFERARNNGLAFLDTVDDDLLRLITASACLEMGDIERAYQLYHEVYTAHPEEMTAEDMRDYAVCLARLGRYAAADDVLLSMREQGTGSDVTDYVMGELADAQGDHTGAEQTFREVISQTEDPELLRRSYLSLITSYEQQGDYGGMIAAALEALDHPELTSCAAVYDKLGYAYFQRGTQSGSSGDLRSAAEAFEREIGLGTDSSQVYESWYIASYTAEDYAGARRAANAMATRYPEDYTPHALLARLCIAENGERDVQDRNYSEFIYEYQMAQSLYVSGEDDPQRMAELEQQRQQLRAAGWIT